MATFLVLTGLSSQVDVSFLVLTWFAKLVVEETNSLHDLCSFVGRMTGKEQKVPGLDFPSESHEQGRVYAESYVSVTRKNNC